MFDNLQVLVSATEAHCIGLARGPILTTSVVPTHFLAAFSDLRPNHIHRVSDS